MTAPFQPERSESSLSSAPTGSGLNSEFANLTQNIQRSSVDRPPVMSADGSQMVIPPLGQTDGTQTSRQLQSAGEQQTAGSQPASIENQQPQSVAYDPSLCVPSWQRFSPTPVATDGTALPADGPGSPGDPGPGPAIPMWMRLAPPGLLNQKQQADQNNSPSNELASQRAGTTGGDGAATSGNSDANVAQIQAQPQSQTQA